MARNREEKPRVFCVGWHKTGTSTLGLALIELGYSVLGARLDMVHPLRRGELESVLNLAGEYDALQDVPWAALFRELDERYPGSKFILTERDEKTWLASASRHFGRTRIPLHDWLYGEGSLVGNEDRYLERYRRHNREVREHFLGQDNRLLVMNLAQGDGWRELCAFLDDPEPPCRFPHTNKSPANYSVVERIVSGVRKSMPSLIRKSVFDLRQWARDRRGLPDPRNRFHNFRENRRERASWKRNSS